MYQGQTVFAQLMDFLPSHNFKRCVNRYDGNKSVRTFSCWDQFLCMAFAQLTYRESLRDTVYALDALTIDLCLSLFPWKGFRTPKRPSNYIPFWICEAVFPLLSPSPMEKSMTSTSWMSSYWRPAPFMSWTGVIWTFPGFTPSNKGKVFLLPA